MNTNRAEAVPGVTYYDGQGYLTSPDVEAPPGTDIWGTYGDQIWYYFAGNASFGDVVIKGDVSIILANNISVATSSISVSYQEDAKLSVYSQTSSTIQMGKLTSAQISADSTALTNTARIETTDGITVQSGTINNAGIIDYVYYGQSKKCITVTGSGSVISNSGAIGDIAKLDYGIYAVGDVSIINDQFGSIMGAIAAIRLGDGGTVDCRSYSYMQSKISLSMSVFAAAVLVEGGVADITSSGIIQGCAAAIAFKRDPSLSDSSGSVVRINHFTNGGGSLYFDSAGIFSDCPVSIINGTAGNIRGQNGIVLLDGGTIENSGLITGVEETIDHASIIASGPVAVINGSGGHIVSEGGCGIIFSGSDDGSVVNDGMITGIIRGIRVLTSGGTFTIDNRDIIEVLQGGIGIDAAAAASVMLINSKTIDGSVILGGSVNAAVLAAGSEINGDLDMSSSAGGSTLGFTGTPAGDPLAYSLVTGTSDIGSAAVSASFEGLPSSYNGIDDIILIDGTGGTVSGSTYNPTYRDNESGYSFFLVVRNGDQLIAVPGCAVTVTIEEGEGTVSIIGTNGTVYGSVTGPAGTEGSFVIPRTAGTAKVSASPESGHEFEKFFMGTADSFVNPSLFTAFWDISVGAYFIEDTVFGSEYLEIIVTIEEGTGSVEVSDSSGICGTVNNGNSGATVNVKKGSDVVLTAAAGTGFEFERLSLDTGDSFVNPSSFAPQGDTQAGAHFIGKTVFEDEYQKITVTIKEGTGSVEVSDPSGIRGTVSNANSGAAVNAEKGSAAVLTAAPAAGWSFAVWEEDASGTNPVYSLIIDSDKSVAAVFGNVPPLPPEPKSYYITSTSDTGSAISPNGVVTVQKGSGQMFFFSAAAGYSISSVTVDGAAISKELVDLGYYTFANVMANHTIDVKSTSAPAAGITLSINIAQGSGRAEYSVNGSPFMKYTSAVGLLPGDSVAVRAVADSGFRFDRWETPAAENEPEISFDNVASSLHLTLRFSGETGSGSTGSGSTSTGSSSTSTGSSSTSTGSRGGSGSADGSDSRFPRWIAVIIVLLAAALLTLWIILFYRRRCDVIKIESETVKIVGDDRVRRKSEYRFTVEGTFEGSISYRIGGDEDTPPEAILPNSDGEYVIPRGVITDDVTIGVV